MIIRNDELVKLDLKKTEKQLKKGSKKLSERTFKKEDFSFFLF